MGSLSDVCTFKGGAQPPKSVFSDTGGCDKIRLIQIRDYKSDKYITYIPRSDAKRFCSASDVMIEGMAHLSFRYFEDWKVRIMWP
jgi:type I restriction enzyme S subunit